MKIEVRYFTKSGNTKLVADAIATEFGKTAIDLDTPLTEYVDLLFLGCSMYKFTIDKKVKDFIKQNAKNIGLIVNFSTSASGASTLKKVKKVANSNGVAILDESFSCYGHFGIFHKNRPDAQDLENAKVFAIDVVRNV